MKEKMTIALVCALIIGLAYFSSFSIESSKSETLDVVELEIELSSMNSCVLEKMDTDLLSFSEAFGYFRLCLGSDSSFQWKGLGYTTLLSEEVIINVADSVLVEEKSKDTEISQIH